MNMQGRDPNGFKGFNQDNGGREGEEDYDADNFDDEEDLPDLKLFDNGQEVYQVADEPGLKFPGVERTSPKQSDDAANAPFRQFSNKKKVVSSEDRVAQGFSPGSSSKKSRGQAHQEHSAQLAQSFQSMQDSGDSRISSGQVAAGYGQASNGDREDQLARQGNLSYPKVLNSQALHNAYEHRGPGERKNYKISAKQVQRIEALKEKSFPGGTGGRAAEKQGQPRFKKVHRPLVPGRTGPRFNYPGGAGAGRGNAPANDVDQIQSWYNKRAAQKQAGQDNQLGMVSDPASRAGATGIAAQNQQKQSNFDKALMVAHYNKHASSSKQQEAFFEHLNNNDKIDFKAKGLNQNGNQNQIASGSSGMESPADPLPSIQRAFQNIQKAGGDEPQPQINVHQHFNQPNITNYNQNAYFLETDEQRQANLLQNRGAKSHSGINSSMARKADPPQGFHVSGNKQHYSAKVPNDDSHFNLRTFQGKNGKGWMGNPERSLAAAGGTDGMEGFSKRNNSQMELQGIKEFNSMDEASRGGMGHGRVLKGYGGGGGPDGSLEESGIIEGAGGQSARYLHQRQVANRGLGRGAGPGVAAAALPNGAFRNINKLPNRNIQPPGISKSSAYYGGVNPYGNFGKSYGVSLKKPLNSIKASKANLPQLDSVQKEDIYDQVIFQKSKINQMDEEVTKTRTRNAVLQEQLRAKDKFIDELLKSTYMMNQAMMSSGIPELASLENSSSRGAGSPARGEVKQANAAYKDLMEKGPYSVLKLKKQVADLKQLVQDKAHENEELQRNIKTVKVQELQEEVKIFEKEYQKLKGITTNLVAIARNNGFESQLRADQGIKDFMDLGLTSPGRAPSRLSNASKSQRSQRNLHDQAKGDINSTQDNRIFQQLVHQNNDMSHQLEIERKKYDALTEQLGNLQEDRRILIELDKKKNEKIRALEEKQDNLRQLNQMQTVIGTRSSQQSLGRSPLKNKQGQQSSQYQIVGISDDNSKDFEEFKKNALAERQLQQQKQVEQLQEDKIKILQQLEEQKNQNQVMEEKMLQLQNKMKISENQENLQDNDKSASRKELMKNIEANNKLQQEKKDLQLKYDQQQNQTRILNQKIRSLEQQQQQSDKAGREHLDQAERLKKEGESKAKTAADLQKQIGQYQHELKLQEARIAQLEQEAAKANHDDLTYTQTAADMPFDAALKHGQSKRFTEKINSTIGKEKRASEANESAQAKRQQQQNLPQNPGAQLGGLPVNVTESQMTSSDLQEERNMIEQRLEEVKMSDLDERSDFQFSQMPSHVHGVTASEVSAIAKPTSDKANNQKLHSQIGNPNGSPIDVKSPYKPTNEIIQEDVENEDKDHSRKLSKDLMGMNKQADSEDVQQLQAKINASIAESEDAGLVKVGRSSSQVVRVGPRKLTVAVPTQSSGKGKNNKLLNQIDKQMVSESRISADESARHSIDASNEEKQMRKFIEPTDNAVRVGFERLGRLMQILRLPLDQVESALLQGKYKASQSIKISELAQIVEERLGLNQSDSVDLARFLIEEKDEESPDILEIEFDPNRKVNSQYIPIRIMTNFKKYPAVYNDAQEAEVQDKFISAFPKQLKKKFIKRLNEQEEAIVSFSQFKDYVSKLMDPKAKLSEADLDCAFILLCRGRKGPFSKEKIRALPNREISEKLRGFDSQSTYLIFESSNQTIVEDDVDEDYSEDQYSADAMKEDKVDGGKAEGLVEEDIDDEPDAKMTNPRPQSDGRVEEDKDEVVSDMAGSKKSGKSKPLKTKGTSSEEYSNPEDFVEEALEDEAKAERGEKPAEDKDAKQETAATAAGGASLKAFTFGPQQTPAIAIQNQLEEEAMEEPKEKAAEGQNVVQGQDIPATRVQGIESPRAAGEATDQRAAEDASQLEAPQNIDKSQHSKGSEASRSDLDFEQQESLGAEKLAAFQFGAEESAQRGGNVLDKYGQGDIDAIREQQATLVNGQELQEQSRQKPSIAEEQKAPEEEDRPAGDSREKSGPSEKAGEAEQDPDQEQEEQLKQEQQNDAGEDKDERRDEQSDPPGKQQEDHPRTGLGNQMSEHKEQSNDGEKQDQQSIASKSQDGKKASLRDSASQQSLNKPPQTVMINMDKVHGELKQELQQKMGVEGLGYIKLRSQEAVRAANEEYEYYDEEDEEEAEHVQAKGPASPKEPAGEEAQESKEEQREESEKERPPAETGSAPEEVNEKPERQGEDEAEAEAKAEPSDSEGSDEKGEIVKFSPEQIKQLKAAVVAVSNKVGNQAQNPQEAIQSVCQIWLLFGGALVGSYPELADSCRDIFREIIYSIRDADVSQADEADQSDPKGAEIEVVRVADLVYKINNITGAQALQKVQIESLETVLGRSKYGGLVLYEDLQTICAALGVCDFKVPKGQQNMVHLDYATLDLKSIRLINRMIHYLGSNNVSFSNFMKDIIQMQTVKTKQASPQVEVFMAKKFFDKLHTHGVKKNSKAHPNLCYFLCIDKKYKEYLMLKKLKRCIIDFNRSAYFQSIGLKKLKLRAAEDFSSTGYNIQQTSPKTNPTNAQPNTDGGDYEYYDEEDEERSNQNAASNSKQAKGNSGQYVAQQAAGARKTAGGANTNHNEDYEYYDEEDDAE